jgi:hypothetical protein
MNIKTLLNESFSKFELLILLSFFIATCLTFFSSSFNVEMWFLGFILSIGYFPLGFYLLGKPTRTSSIWFSVFCGAIYSIAIVSILYNSTDLIGKDILLVISALTLLSITAIILSYKRKSIMSLIYLNGQLVRISILFLLQILTLFR